MKRICLAAFFAASILAISSCEGTYTVATQPSRPMYSRPPSPGMGYIWIEGDWRYEGNNYVWHEGRWARERSNRHYRPGSWEQRNNGWYWRRGRWE
jgi:hypothetical protein